MTPLLSAWLVMCAYFYGVDPNFALRVARVESGTRTQEFRVGRLGRTDFWGPMGIRGRYIRGMDMDNPYLNVMVGVRALRGADKRQVLTRYYGGPPPQAYLKAVLGK